MQKNLVIVESPAKAKTIEKFLGKDFKVCSSYGHIRDLAKKGIGIDVENGITAKDKKNNNRNGYCKSKKVETKYGSIEVKTPRDRNGTFNPIIIEKRQTKLTGFEDKCISLYAKGMSLRDIEQILKD